jgi:dienelactone hydrolase
MMRKSFTLYNKDNEIIRGDLHYRNGIRNAPAIIACHGFKGFKDWGFFPFLAERLAEDGYVVITFNFSRNGIGTDMQNFTEPDMFAKNTLSHEITDLKLLAHHVYENKIGNSFIDTERIGLMGYSRGGGIALLYTAIDNRVKALVTWAAISTFQRYDEEQLRQWQEKGYIEIENKRTKQIMRLDKEVLDDLLKNKKKLDILAAARKIEMPTLIIHGDQDTSVPVDEGKIIYENLGCEVKNLEIIEGAGHTLEISHPMSSISDYFGTALDLTENWFDNYL